MAWVDARQRQSENAGEALARGIAGMAAKMRKPAEKRIESTAKRK
jgi:hypothetical protein